MWTKQVFAMIQIISNLGEIHGSIDQLKLIYL